MNESIYQYSLFNSGIVVQYLPALASPFFGMSKLIMPNKTLSINKEKGFFLFNETVEENILVGAYVPQNNQLIIEAIQMFFNR